MATIDEQRTAHHEAGHALAAFCLSDPGDEPFEGISLVPKDGFRAHAAVNQHYDWGDGREGLEREIMVLLAGAVTEEVVYGRALDGVDDEAEVYALLDGADWVKDKSWQGEEVQSYLAKLRNRLKGEFTSRSNWRLALEQLAEELIAKRKILYREAAELLNRAFSAAGN